MLKQAIYPEAVVSHEAHELLHYRVLGGLGLLSG